MDRDLRFEIDAGVALVTLHRPEQRNAFSAAMGEELGRAYAACDEADSVRAVVLTGAGDAFCAGADMGGGSGTFAKRDEATFSASDVVDPPAWRVRKPVIAAMNGHAVGIGLSLAMQCDIRLAALEGRYGFLHVRRGVVPDAYAHWTVPRAIGFARAADVMLTGRRFSGEEAVALGIASRALPSAEVLPAALAIARDIAANTAPLSVALCKRLLWESPSLSADEVGRAETELHQLVMGQPDAIEGVMAFLERRAPEWKLRLSESWPQRFSPGSR